MEAKNGFKLTQMPQKKIYLTDYNCVTPLGISAQENWDMLKRNISGVKTQYFSADFPEVCASVIDDETIDKITRLNPDIQSLTRLEKLLVCSLKRLVEKQGITDKSVLILSTTKGNISQLKGQAEPPLSAYLYRTAQQVADYFGFKTTPVVVSNACVSGVMAVGVGKNLLQSDLYDQAFVIAGDEVTDFVLAGFNSFQAMSTEPCRPYDKLRNGINIGEATAAVFLTKEKPADRKFFEVLGDSSINDANHISGPHRTGEGLYRSVVQALKEAQLSPEDIDYISAHGTATLYNDEMESFAFSRAGLSKVPLNSLKGYYGHCLGASGLLELIMAMESAANSLLIKNLNFNENGVSQPINIIKQNTVGKISTILKTASGFGGCNSAIILKNNDEEA